MIWFPDSCNRMKFKYWSGDRKYTLWIYFRKQRKGNSKPKPNSQGWLKQMHLTLLYVKCIEFHLGCIEWIASPDPVEKENKKRIRVKCKICLVTSYSIWSGFLTFLCLFDIFFDLFVRAEHTIKLIFIIFFLLLWLIINLFLHKFFEEYSK